MALFLVTFLAGCGAPAFTYEACPAVAGHPCAQRITQADAQRVAREAGLGTGLDPWFTEFGWRADPSRPEGGFHVWTVHNTTAGTGYYKGYEGYGSAAVMEAGNGRFVEMLEWGTRPGPAP